MTIENEVEVGSFSNSSVNVKVTNMFLTRTEKSDAKMASLIIPIRQIDSVEVIKPRKLWAIVFGIVTVAVILYLGFKVNAAPSFIEMMAWGLLVALFAWLTQRIYNRWFGLRIHSVSGKTQLFLEHSYDNQKIFDNVVQAIQEAITTSKKASHGA